VRKRNNCGSSKALVIKRGNQNSLKEKDEESGESSEKTARAERPQKIERN